MTPEARELAISLVTATLSGPDGPALVDELLTDVPPEIQRQVLIDMAMFVSAALRCWSSDTGLDADRLWSCIALNNSIKSA